jgi:hypothetical protein
MSCGKWLTQQVCIYCMQAGENDTMMNPHEHPWERQHAARHSTATHDYAQRQSSGRGFVWLLAVILAVVGLAAMGRHGANPMVIVPVGISLFFMLMFIVSFRREARRIEAEQQMERLERAARRATEPDVDEPEYHQPREHHFGAPVPYGNGQVNEATREIFDRFDVRVIELARDLKLKPKDAAGLLEFARDFVDVPHASRLLRMSNNSELECHLDAAIERAVLQHAISTDCPKMLKVRKRDSMDFFYVDRDNDDEPPF